MQCVGPRPTDAELRPWAYPVPPRRAEDAPEPEDGPAPKQDKGARGQRALAKLGGAGAWMLPNKGA